MNTVWKALLASAIATGSAYSQIGGLSTTADGRSVFFGTTEYIRQRGSSQSFLRRLFLLRDKALTVVDEAQTSGGPGYSGYLQTGVSADGAVRAINRDYYCGPPPCRSGRSTLVQTPTGTFSLGGTAAITGNGRFAAISPLLEGIVQRMDLVTGQLSDVGLSLGTLRVSPIAEDGTILVRGRDTLRLQLIGPNGSRDLAANYFFDRPILAGDASRIIYQAGTSRPQDIRVFEVNTGMDRSLGRGEYPSLARDGVMFSFLRSDDSTEPFYAPDNQVWLGDAVSGLTRRLSNETDYIREQTITGDGSAVIAVTHTGRLLSINTVTGAVTQLLDSPGPDALLTPAVPGSYNEVVGSFREGVVPRVWLGGVPAIVLGTSPRGYAIQVPWETPVYVPEILVHGNEPAWERRSVGTVMPFFGIVLPLVLNGPTPPSGTLGAFGPQPSYAIHEDWSGPVNRENPARPAETIHFYGTGWGPVDGAVASGQPAPADRLYRMITPCDWRATGSGRNPFEGTKIEPVFAGLAPGLVGVYQLDFRVPPDWTEPVFYASCILTSGSMTTGSSTPPIDVRP